MDANIIIEILESYGLPMVIAVALYLKWTKDTKELKKYLDKKEEEHKKFVNEYVNERVNELKDELHKAKDEAREDKMMFKKAIEIFQNSVNSSTIINDNIKDIKTEMKIIKKDMVEIKNDVESIKGNK